MRTKHIKNYQKNHYGRVHGMAELQEMGKYLLSRFHSVKMVGFYNGKNIHKEGALNGVLSLFLVPKQHAQNPGSGELFSFYMDTILIV